MLEVANDEAHDYGPIDSIPCKGGPISQKDHTAFRRQHFTDGQKLALRKKKDGNDDSESDNSDDEAETRPGTKDWNYTVGKSNSSIRNVKRKTIYYVWGIKGSK